MSMEINEDSDLSTSRSAVAISAITNSGSRQPRTEKNAGARPAFLISICFAQAKTFFIRCARRETLREAVLRCRTPLPAARISSGWAALKAASAAALSPAAIAASTLRTQVRTREIRLLLIAVRRAILRAAFLAEVVLAMVPLYPTNEPGDRRA